MRFILFASEITSLKKKKKKKKQILITKKKQTNKLRYFLFNFSISFQEPMIKIFSKSNLYTKRIMIIKNK
jgi:hypothetical protein